MNRDPYGITGTDYVEIRHVTDVRCPKCLSEKVQATTAWSGYPGWRYNCFCCSHSWVPAEFGKVPS